MLTKIKLTNFRGFADHELPVQQLTLIVGRNNAGKSTIIEALRFISLATARYRTLNYVDPPDEFDLPETHRGISPSLRDVGVEHQNLFYRYGEPPATITAEFGNAGSVVVYLFGNDEIFIVVRNELNQIVPSNAHARRLTLPHINILPQLVPVADTEEPLNPRYVRNSLSTARSSIHFRNELLILNEFFLEFKRLSEESWPRLQMDISKNLALLAGS